MKPVLPVLLLSAAAMLVIAVGWDVAIMRDDNCDAGEAALCLTSMFFLEPQKE